jgi:hypothetical protein
MLTGELAFEGGGPELLQHLVDVAPKPVSERAPWVPTVFDRVIGRALSKNPQDRYRSISRFAWALENAAASAGIDESPPSSEAPLESELGARRRDAQSDPPTRVDREAYAKTEPSLYVPPVRKALDVAEGLLEATREAFDKDQLDDAVHHAERLIELAVQERDADVLRRLAPSMPLLDAIFEARLGPPGGELVPGPSLDKVRRRLSPRAAELLAHIDRGMTVHEVLETSAIPRRDCVRLLAGLLRRKALLVSR